MPWLLLCLRPLWLLRPGFTRLCLGWLRLLWGRLDCRLPIRLCRLWRSCLLWRLDLLWLLPHLLGLLWLHGPLNALRWR